MNAGNVDWASNSLQGLAYWLGFQDSYGIDAEINEGSIALVFTTLLLANRATDSHVETEVMYKYIPEYSSNDDVSNRKHRADIVLAKKRRQNLSSPYLLHDVQFVIEIKHIKSSIHLVWDDIDYLGNRKKDCNNIRAFLLYASINKRPKHFTLKTGAAKRSKQFTPTNQTPFKVRRACRSTSKIPCYNKMADGHYAILIEVL